MSEQLELLSELDEEEAIADIINDWWICWQWSGPEVGKPLTVGVCCPECGGYWYCTRCIAIKKVDEAHWLYRVEYLPDAPQHCLDKNGTMLNLHLTEIWPPTDDLRAERKKKENEIAKTN